VNANCLLFTLLWQSAIARTSDVVSGVDEVGAGNIVQADIKRHVTTSTPRSRPILDRIILEAQQERARVSMSDAGKYTLYDMVCSGVGVLLMVPARHLISRLMD
jgi:regulator of extracellular matrix RemA (YlzA/DUF370 family)